MRPSVQPQAIYHRVRREHKSVKPADLLALQRITGNRAVARALDTARTSPNGAYDGPSPATEGWRAGPPQLSLTAQQASKTMVQRNGDDQSSTGSSDAPTLDQRYNQALQAARQTGNWQEAAELLNGFNHEDIQSRLAQLTAEEVGYLHLGALDNPRVGPDSQVAQLTKPGTAPASTLPPASTQVPHPPAAPPAIGPSPAVTNKAISEMTAEEKLLEAYNRADIDAAVREKFASLMTPQALVAAIIAFAVAFVVSQFTPVGWAADIGLALTGIFVGTALFTAIQHLIRFADARNATTPEELDRAGAEFAAAVAEIEVDALILVITHGAAGAPKGTVPYQGPPPVQFALATTEEGALVPVVVRTIPAEVANQIGAGAGARASAATGALMSTRGGSGGNPAASARDRARTAEGGERGPQPPSPGAWRGKPKIENGDLKEGWVHIESRHITGTHPDGPGDLFARGTTRKQLEDAARTIVQRGERISDPARRIQVFERRITINGQSDPVRVVVDTADGRVITMFPVRGG